MTDIAEQTAAALNLISEATRTIIDMLYGEASPDDAVAATQRAALAAKALHDKLNQ